MKKIIIISTLFIILFSSQVFGNTLNFTDNSKYWPGWGNTQSADNIDEIGIPKFTGGTITLDNSGKLIQLDIYQSETSWSLWGVLSPGDLFISTDSDSDWEFFVDLTTWTTSGPLDSDPSAGNYSMYSISLPLNSSTGYIKSGQDNTGNWQGYDIRDNHPVAYDATAGIAGTYYGNVYFSGWNGSPSPKYTFTFTGRSGLPNSGLQLGQDFAIGWTVNCANDVIYQTEHNPVPEPATMFLLGSGLIGLAGFARRKFRK